MRSLYARISFILTLLLGLVGLLFVLLIGHSTERYQQEVAQRLNATLADNIVGERLLFRDDGSIDSDALESIFHMLMVINPKVELYLLDPAGRILAFSAPPGKVQRKSVNLEPVRAFIDGRYTAPLQGDDPRGGDRRKVFSAAPIDVDGARVGYLYVILAGEQYDSVTGMLSGSYVIKASVLMAVLLVVFALLAGLLLFALLTRRLRGLTHAVEGFQRAGFTGRLPKAGRSGDEIDRLTLSFNAMAERIDAQVRRLERTDSQRRELIANVSHDLRTPLASLQGYIETLHIRADSLDDAERRRYLDIAQKHCQRLGRLIGELFELAKLDANEVRPVPEPFLLSDLVQDVLQKFELQAGQRDIELSMRHEGDLPFVMGDIALIERVLSNLLENAIRHTPAKGCVTVAMRPVDDAVAVRVMDTGAGIDADDLPHIFERFYQPAQSGTPGGAGLGLAIAKRIIELHGSVIHAVSEVGRGTAFDFDLPARPAH